MAGQEIIGYREAKTGAVLPREDGPGGIITDDRGRNIPTDLLLEVLSRVPASCGASLRGLSRDWRAVYTSGALREARRLSGRVEQWLFVLPEDPRGGPFRAYDPKAFKWHVVPPLPPSRGSSRNWELEGFACAAAAGRLFVIGGAETEHGRPASSDPGGVTATVWSFDPLAWAWRREPSMGTARSWCAAVALDDQYVLVSGGQGRASFLRSAEVYDTEKRQWRAVAPMTVARSSHRAVVLGGQAVVIAGEWERHDPPSPPREQREGDAARQGAPGERNGDYRAAALGPRWGWSGPRFGIVGAQGPAAGVGGGLGGRRMLNASMEVYDVHADSWRLLPDAWLSTEKVPCPVAAVGGRLYAVQHGGVHVWVAMDEGSDPLTSPGSLWRRCGDTPGHDSGGRAFAVAGAGSAELDGRLLLFGGTRDVWVQRSRLTRQQLNCAHEWQPCSTPSLDWGDSGPDALPPASLQSLAAASSSGIMLWKELPVMEPGRGHILAAAVLTF